VKELNNVAHTLRLGREFLRTHKIESHGQDANLILAHVLGFSKTMLYTKDDYILTDFESEQYSNLLERRISGVPVKYILGECEFMGHMFMVNENVLIPRPDTETLVNAYIEANANQQFNTILDMCTGSGCVAVSICKATNPKTMLAADVSEQALDVARKNAQLNGCNIEFYRSNLFESVPKKYIGVLDAIVSNPPYIKREDIKTLTAEVQNEPLLALDGGPDGLDFYRRIINGATQFLKPGGRIFFETGHDQAAKIGKLLADNGFCDIITVCDLAGIQRVVSAKF